MSVASEIGRIEIIKEEINDHLESLGVNRGASLAEMAQNITVLKKPTGSAGQLLGFVEDDVIGAVDAQSGSSFVKHAYIVGQTPYAANWLSLTEGGNPLTPIDGIIYEIQTQRDRYGCLFEWVSKENRYRIFGNKNIAETASIIRNFDSVEYGYASVNVTGGSVDKTTLVTIPVKKGDYLHIDLRGSVTYCTVFVGFEGDTSLSKTYDGTSTINLTEEWHITEEIAALNKPFVISYDRASSEANRNVTINAGTVVLEKTLSVSETQDYVPPTATKSGQTGLLPAPDTGETTHIFMSNGKWENIKNLIGRSFASNGLVGEVCLYMSPIVPPHFLACDGVQYNADDYPQLFRVLKEVDASVRSTWGNANWTTTFNVPNIQGEFPRFSGTNSHANQGNGGVVGAHQDGTEIPNTYFDTNGNNFAIQNLSTASGTQTKSENFDFEKNGNGTLRYVPMSQSAQTEGKSHYTSRPTNTSFFGVIRYEVADDASIHGGAPVGTIFPYDGMTAPDGYLLCDGTVYNISAQQELAEHIKKQHGSYNFYGGDGTTTFAVPDLRGEFIRGAGTNSHVNQGSGAGVGVHQAGTLIPRFGATNAGGTPVPNVYLGYSGSSTTGTAASNEDYKRIIGGTTLKRSNATTNSSFTVGDTTVDSDAYTIRPTNTSYNYIIKSSSFDNKGGENYSLDEKRIGTWIGGEPLYMKVIEIASLPNASTVSYSHNVLNIDKKVSIEGLMEFSTGTTVPLPHNAQDEDYQLASKNSVGLRFESEVIDVITGIDRSNCKGTIFIKYTKTTD